MKPVFQEIAFPVPPTYCASYGTGYFRGLEPADELWRSSEFSLSGMSLTKLRKHSPFAKRARWSPIYFSRAAAIRWSYTRRRHAIYLPPTADSSNRSWILKVSFLNSDAKSFSPRYIRAIKFYYHREVCEAILDFYVNTSAMLYLTFAFMILLTTVYYQSGVKFDTEL